MLTGSYLRSLDSKGRISLPKVIRDRLGQELAASSQATSSTDAAESNATDSGQLETLPADPAQDSRGASIYLTPGTDGSLDVYSPTGFHELARRIHAKASVTEDGRAFRRLFYAQAVQVDIDRQGRFRIPAELMELGGLTQEVMLVGVGDHLEAWDPQRWKEYLADKQQQYDSIAEKTLHQIPET